MPDVAEKTFAVAEYFELEKTSRVRHEFVHGTLIEMPGEKKKANEIAGNCYFALRQALKGKGQKIYEHDVRTMVEAGNIYRYPDLVVAPETDRDDEYNVTQPGLIIEVLSERTEQTDRNKKLKEYCRIPSLRYYLLVSQDECLVETYSRKGEEWIYDFHTKPTEIIQLDFYQATLELSAIYENIKLAG